MIIFNKTKTYTNTSPNHEGMLYTIQCQKYYKDGEGVQSLGPWFLPPPQQAPTG